MEHPFFLLLPVVKTSIRAGFGVILRAKVATARFWAETGIKMLIQPPQIFRKAHMSPIQAPRQSHKLPAQNSHPVGKFLYNFEV